MKRLLGTLIVAILTVGSLTACGKKDGANTAATSASTGPSDSAAFGEGPGGSGARLAFQRRRPGHRHRGQERRRAHLPG